LEKKPIEVSTSMAGDTDKDLVLTEARHGGARVLIENFAFDGAELKTLGVGKKSGDNGGSWGTVEMLIYPPETVVSTNRAPSQTRQ
jgi:hypothetical protein